MNVLSEGGKELACISNPEFKMAVETAWARLESEMALAYAKITPSMERKELSFHNSIKLLGYLCLENFELPGDILEIGVWKGKSLTLMSRLSSASSNIIGVDPCELDGQHQELLSLLQVMSPRSLIIPEYSERAVRQVLAVSRKIKLLHIDGGHLRDQVWSDFIIYSQVIRPGGYIVFDDYDTKDSPEVGPAIDEMYRLGFFEQFDVLGPVAGFKHSYVLKKL